MTRICFILPHYFNYNKGGAELQSKLIAERLSIDNSIHYIFTLPISMHKKVKSEEENIHLHPIQKHQYKLLGKFFVLNYLEIIRLLKNIKPNIVYQRGDHPFIGMIQRWCEKHGIKTIIGISMDLNCTKNGILKFGSNYLSYPSNLLNGYLSIQGIKKTDVLIAQSKRQQQMLKKNFNRESIILKNGFSIPDQPFKKVDTPLISWIANIKPLKQPELFIQLAKRCEDLPAKFIIAGRPAQKNIQNQINKLIQTTSNITYLGEIPFEKTNKILSKSLLLVNTSITEGFSNTYIQAWMRETPVITLNCDPDDIIKTNNIGIHSKNFENLVRDVRYLITNKNEVYKMGREARKYSIQHHDIKKIAKQYNQLFNKIIK